MLGHKDLRRKGVGFRGGARALRRAEALGATLLGALGPPQALLAPSTYDGVAQRRFFAKIEAQASPSDCWPWTGSKNTKGYGQLGYGPESKKELAHRLAYRWWVGEIPLGLILHHECHSGHLGCVSPLHLRAVTRSQNTQAAADEGRTWSQVVKHALRRPHEAGLRVESDPLAFRQAMEHAESVLKRGEHDGRR